MTKIIDNHCHIYFTEKIEDSVKRGEEYIAELGLQKLGMLSYPYVHRPEMEVDVLENLKALYYKEKCSIPVYAFGGFTHYCDAGEKMADFMKRMIAMGFDGWKSAEMHPRLHRLIGKGLADPSFDETLSYVEENGIPIVCHLGDPRFHWDAEEATDWLREHGRFYDGSFPNIDDLYDEMEQVLEKHPKLKIALAHFYFTSDDYERSVHMLSDFENVYYDLTPGSEMFVNFSKNTDLWRDFFIRFSDKIIMGSDLYATGYGRERHRLVRNFLEGTEPFDFSEEKRGIIPIHLEEEYLEKIYWQNAERFNNGPEPKAVDRKLAYEYCLEVEELYGDTMNEIGKQNLEVFKEFWK